MKQPLSGIFQRFSPGRLYNKESLRDLSRVAVLLLVAAASQACASQEPLTGPWTVQIATSGGLAGKGAGNYSITSEGTITVLTPAQRSCSFRATDEELARITRLVQDSRPEEWAADYVPEQSCCDRFNWTLTLTTERRTFTTRWIDAPEPMPRPLVALASAIAWNGDASNLRRVYGSRCH